MLEHQSTHTILDERSRAIRETIVNAFISSNRGHLAPALSLVEILRVLYDDILQYDPNNPNWDDRDRFILSKGHGCLALYAMLAEKGFIPRSELSRACSFDGILGGHPERNKVPGVEASTGSLGHGFSIGIGMALRARLDKKAYRVFVVIGDGESNEGAIWEAALTAGKYGLSNLTLIVDRNHMQSYGPSSDILDIEPLADKFRAFNFSVADVDGHDVHALHKVFSSMPLHPEKPSALICHTIKGKGIEGVEENISWHHKSKISLDEAQSLMKGIR